MPRMPVIRLVSITFLLSSFVLLGQPSDQVTQKATKAIQKNCIGCHGENGMSGLDLRTREAALKGGSRGPAIVPGKSKESILVQAVLRDGKLQMPPGKTALPNEDVEAIREWVDSGANWTATVTTATPKATWWSFIPPKRPAVPDVADSAWSANPVDAFVYAKLKEKGLKPAALASPQTLVRRAYVDITGLPPTPEQVKAFLSDNSPDAY